MDEVKFFCLSFMLRPQSGFVASPALNQEKRQAALEHLKAGASISAIAREFGTSRQTIMRLRDDAVSQELPE
nr:MULTISPECIES: helix-turn-helix domain-containing protein [unclassified Tatumella]